MMLAVKLIVHESWHIPPDLEWRHADVREKAAQRQQSRGRVGCNTPYDAINREHAMASRSASSRSC